MDSRRRREQKEAKEEWRASGQIDTERRQTDRQTDDRQKNRNANRRRCCCALCLTLVASVLCRHCSSTATQTTPLHAHHILTPNHSDLKPR